MNSSLYFLIGFIGLIMLIEMANNFFDHAFNAYGLVPRTIQGLAGIPLGPFLHGSFAHVQSNSVGLLALGTLAVMRSGSRFPWVCLAIALVAGVALWGVGRPATHVGASGLVFGLFGYLLLKGVLDRSILSILVALVVAAVFGTIILSGLLPADVHVSWEGHLCGLGAGFVAAVVIPNEPSPSQRSGAARMA